jgi:hypothetical protein
MKMASNLKGKRDDRIHNNTLEAGRFCRCADCLGGSFAVAAGGAAAAVVGNCLLFLFCALILFASSFSSASFDFFEFHVELLMSQLWHTFFSCYLTCLCLPSPSYPIALLLPLWNCMLDVFLLQVVPRPPAPSLLLRVLHPCLHLLLHFHLEVLLESLSSIPCQCFFLSLTTLALQAEEISMLKQSKPVKYAMQ